MSLSTVRHLYPLNCGKFAMHFLYCFCNASLTQRVLTYLSKKLRRVNHCATVIFLNDCWIVRIEIKPGGEGENFRSIEAFLNENGFPYSPCSHIQRALDDCIAGNSLVDVMNRHHVAVISHGKPHLEDVRRFREAFVKGLGYCPPSLV